MTEDKYMNRELENRVADAGTYYHGMRQLLDSPEMPEEVRKSAGHYALALMAAHEHDAVARLPDMHPKVLRKLINYALEQTPIKGIEEPKK